MSSSRRGALRRPRVWTWRRGPVQRSQKPLLHAGPRQPLAAASTPPFRTSLSEPVRDACGQHHARHAASPSAGTAPTTSPYAWLWAIALACVRVCVCLRTVCACAWCVLAHTVTHCRLSLVVHPSSPRQACMHGRTGLTPAQLTALNMDKTEALVGCAAGRWGGDARKLVGEMQFAFVAFMCGQSLQGELEAAAQQGGGRVCTTTMPSAGSQAIRKAPTRSNRTQIKALGSQQPRWQLLAAVAAAWQVTFHVTCCASCRVTFCSGHRTAPPGQLDLIGTHRPPSSPLLPLPLTDNPRLPPMAGSGGALLRL
jgi:hypothetical protein